VDGEHGQRFLTVIFDLHFGVSQRNDFDLRLAHNVNSDLIAARKAEFPGSDQTPLMSELGVGRQLSGHGLDFG
jgi:hypothetical protein